jgi:hypothetical protein
VSDDTDLAVILDAARDLYGRTVWSHKVQEQEREIWTRRVSSMNRVNIGLAGLTTLFAVIAASIPQTWNLILTAVFAAAAVCFSIWQASSDPAAHESRHRVAAKELLWIREQLYLLITNCHIGTTSKDDLHKTLELLTREVTAVYKFAPDTSPEALKAAEGMLKKGFFFFSDGEIDGFLPTELRKTKPTGDTGKA